jgi:hypothetical protein
MGDVILARFTSLSDVSSASYVEGSLHLCNIGLRVMF